MMTLRSDCGRTRASYHPEWGTESPWISYVQGTAQRHHRTLRSAASYLETHWNSRFKKWNLT